MLNDIEGLNRIESDRVRRFYDRARLLPAPRPSARVAFTWLLVGILLGGVLVAILTS